MGKWEYQVKVQILVEEERESILEENENDDYYKSKECNYVNHWV